MEEIRYLKNYIARRILHSPYHIKNYVDLVREIFPDVRIVAPEKLNKEFSNFSSHIEGSAHVGTFQTPDKKKIIIMAVQLKKAVLLFKIAAKRL